MIKEICNKCWNEVMEDSAGCGNREVIYYR